MPQLQLVFELFPDLPPAKVLYTPNFAGPDEYQYGFLKGVNVTLDNIHLLHSWPDLLRNRTVFLRIDPGKGLGHHSHVM